MATSATIQCAIDVAALINAAPDGTFSQSFTAERLYVPRYELENADALKVFVVPAGIESEFNSRSTTQDEHEIDIAVLQKLTKGGGVPSELDPFMLTPEEIQDFLSGDDLSGNSRRNLSSGPHLIKIGVRPIFSPDHITEKQILFSMITATYRGFSKFR